MQGTFGSAEITAGNALKTLCGKYRVVVISRGYGNDGKTTARLLAGGLYKSGTRVLVTPEPVPPACAPFFAKGESGVAIAVLPFTGNGGLILADEKGIIPVKKGETPGTSLDFYEEGLACGMISTAEGGYDDYIKALTAKFLPTEKASAVSRKGMRLAEGEYGWLFRRLSGKTALYSPMNGRAFRSLPHVLTLMGFKDVIPVTEDAYPSDKVRVGLNGEGFLRAVLFSGEGKSGDVFFASDAEGTKLLLLVKENGKFRAVTDEELRSSLEELQREEPELMKDVRAEFNGGVRLQPNNLWLPDASAGAIYIGSAFLAKRN